MGLIRKIGNLNNRMKWNKQLKKFKSVGEKCRCNRYFSIREPEHISLGSNFNGGESIGIHVFGKYKNKTVCENPEIVIGDNVTMGKYSYISCANRVEVGNGVMISTNAFVTDNVHGQSKLDELDIPPSDRMIFSKGPVVLGDNVWLGRNVVVMPNVKIGKGSVIGANAVVTHDIPDYSIAAGVPAKVLRTLK